MTYMRPWALYIISVSSCGGLSWKEGTGAREGFRLRDSDDGRSRKLKVNRLEAQDAGCRGVQRQAQTEICALEAPCKRPLGPPLATVGLLLARSF